MIDFIISIILVFFIYTIKTIEFVYTSVHCKYNFLKEETTKKSFMTFVVILYLILILIISIIDIILPSLNLKRSFILAIVIVLIVDLLYLFDISLKRIKFTPKKKTIIWISIISLMLIIITTTQFLIPANVRGEVSWFTDMFIKILDMEENTATIGFIAVGTLVLISGTVSDNVPLASVGGLFLLLLPLYTIMDCILNPLVMEYVKTTLLYTYIPNIVISMLIYTVLLVSLNSFMILLILLLFSMINKSSLK